MTLAPIDASTNDGGSTADLVDGLLQQARDCAASDLHLVPTANGLEVALRCNGVLTVTRTLAADQTGRVLGRIKALADLLAYRTDVPQEGRIPDGRGPGTGARVSIYPTVTGEKVAVRLATRSRAVDTLDSLGLSATSVQALRDVLAEPDGVVLVTGPSGSGKSTTLYAALEHMHAQPTRRHILTVEDPVERLVPGVVQTELDPAAGLTYDTALPAILRQDPDVILVGEVRDARTARTVLEAGLTGHLVASTMHAGSCAATFVRLIEMGVEPFAITSVVRGVLAQRLLRRCCAEPIADHHGCKSCAGTGFAGLVAVDEWAPMTDELRRALLDRGDVAAVAAALQTSNEPSLRRRAEQLVAAGATTTEEVDRVLGRDVSVRAADSLRQHRSELVPPPAGAAVPGRRAVAQGPAPARA